jgi:hypothetical protein
MLMTCIALHTHVEVFHWLDGLTGFDYNVYLLPLVMHNGDLLKACFSIDPEMGLDLVNNIMELCEGLVRTSKTMD